MSFNILLTFCDEQITVSCGDNNVGIFEIDYSLIDLPSGQQGITYRLISVNGNTFYKLDTGEIICYVISYHNVSSWIGYLKFANNSINNIVDENAVINYNLVIDAGEFLQGPVSQNVGTGEFHSTGIHSDLFFESTPFIYANKVDSSLRYLSCDNDIKILTSYTFENEGGEDVAVITAILAVFTGIGNWFIETIPNVMNIFWNATDGELTILGALAVAALAIAVILMIFYKVREFFRFR